MTRRATMGLAALGSFAAITAAACGDDASDGTGGGAQGGAIEVQISGEELATDGFAFPTGSEVTIADGWSITFDHAFVVVDRVFVSDNPDTNPTDQSATGAIVAEAAGPWVVDLAIPGSVPGAGGEGTATPLVTIANQNLADGAPFEADTRYAFGYALGTATSAATIVNFAGDAAAEETYARMIEGGYTMFFVGRATFDGGDACTSSDPSYDFAALPTEFPFALGFATPADYLNCQNEENEGDPFPDEEFQRGLSIKANAPTTAQLTLHLDHLLYSDVEHEPVLYFDQYAAQLVGQPAGTELTLDALEGVDPTAFVDGAGTPLPWRRCDGGELPQTTQRAFEAGSIPIGPGQDPAQGLRDYRDFVSYVQSSLGHLNGGEGICFTKRGYPSPP